MRFRADRYREMRSLVRPDFERDVEEELRHHVEQSIADGVATGLSEEQARERALRRFGDVDRYRRDTVAVDERAKREEKRMQLFDAIRRETVHAWRSLLHTPLFFVVALLTLAVGIGATSSIYTLLDSIVLRPLSYPEPDRLVQVRHAVPGIQADMRFQSAVAQYYYYAADNRVFASLGAASPGTYALAEGGAAERVDGAAVTASLLDVFGVRTVLGRPLTSADEAAGATDVVLLSHELWRSAFDGDPGVLNRQVRINGVPRTVVGVVAPGARLPYVETLLWVPLQLDRSAPAENSHWLETYARLRPGVTTEAAQRDVARMVARLPELFPSAYSERFMRESGFSAVVTSVRSELLGGIERVLWMLLAAVLLVLLIAAANVANLFLVRTESRRREIALRSSLGAERAHLAVQYLAEALTLSLLAAGLGLVFAWLGTRLLVAGAPSGIPRVHEIGMSARVVLVALATAVLAGLVFGLFPVLRASVDYNALREGGRGLTASRRQHFARNALVAGQMAMALVLLAAGALLLQSYVNLRRVDDGIREAGVLTFEVSAPYSRYGEHADVHRFYRELTQRLSVLPGVESVGGTVLLPFGGGSHCAYTTAEGVTANDSDRGCVPTPQVLPGYFEAMGIRVRGETFDWGMMDRREGVAVISRALADRLFPGVDPIGRGIMSYRDGPPWYRIIGVAEDVRHDGYHKPPIQAVYYPQMPMDMEGTWMPARSMTMTLRTRHAEPDALARSLRQVMRELDPEVPVANIRTMGDVIARSDAVARTSFTLLLLSVAAVMALFLSVVGLYGVISYVVAQRRSEIGVRLALGARADQVRLMVLAQSLRVVLLGVAIGLPAAFFGGRLLRSLLFGVTPADPATLLGVALALVFVAGGASYIPALRAAAVPPMQVLRED